MNDEQRSEYAKKVFDRLKKETGAMQIYRENSDSAWLPLRSKEDNDKERIEFLSSHGLIVVGYTDDEQFIYLAANKKELKPKDNIVTSVPIPKLYFSVLSRSSID